MLYFYKELAWGTFPYSWPGIWEHICQMPLKENSSNWQRCRGRLGRIYDADQEWTWEFLHFAAFLPAVTCNTLPLSVRCHRHQKSHRHFFCSFERGICGSHFSINLSGSYHEFQLIFPLRSKTILLLASWPLFLTIILNCLISGLTGHQKYCFH